ncbi:gliding motility-associated ABC transporter ATP-binding subunit GldA [Echinicola marina]|uniref:gliding motility-associated ABC transporter ATP-binding subunit GldA n=1 Tax=Echinicola marina TaxID=2859768 RepID=UPI001CF6E99D|nr:gliding motility-associated ABC transporter ATP-binding subunit GldA [Echinicola marina]UCS93722.1 gliding motility-associated ABC transporter ATP-binding subunit GldA [Echinicola marina]
MSLQVKQLSKFYKKQKALDQVSFEARPGQVLGFLGPNGAGKSTTMKIAAGYILPDQGDVLVDGISSVECPEQTSRLIGYLPEHNPLYLDMYVKEFLGFMAGLHHLKGKSAKDRIEEVLESCGLIPEQHKKIGALSKGYRQRVGLAKALVHDPKVIILDEPTTGLDPNQLVEIRKLIKTISKDKTLILSTHIMQEVEALCEKVVIIHQGKVVAQDLLVNLRGEKDKAVLVLETDESLKEEWFIGLPGLDRMKLLGERQIQISTDVPGHLRKALIELIHEKGLTLLNLNQVEKNLETIFHQLTESDI